MLHVFIYYGYKFQSIKIGYNRYSSKFPPAFNFHIHIDDLKGVGIEGEKYGFKTIIIKPSDKDWIIKINNKLKELENII